MKNLLFLLISLFLVNCLNARQKQVVFTIDDLPTVIYQKESQDYGYLLTQKLVDELVAAKIPAVGFVNERKLYPEGKLDSSQVRILEYWTSHGLELGNHTYSHPSYHRTSYADYTQEIIRGEVITRDLLKKSGKTLRYFRHPFLHIGLTRGAADSLQAFLEKNEYIVSPVTIDNSDYLFAKAYHVALSRGKKDKADKIATAYLEHTSQVIAYYEKISEYLFQRQLPHILLIHANKLNADTMPEFIKLFREKGYDFVTQEEALLDKAYQKPVTEFGGWGISWLERWLMGTEKAGELFRSAPVVPEY